MIQLITETERCKACGYCVQACPVQALAPSDRLNRAGYEYVAADREKCVLCGTCYTVCPDLVFELREEVRA